MLVPRTFETCFILLFRTAFVSQELELKEDQLKDLYVEDQDTFDPSDGTLRQRPSADSGKSSSSINQSSLVQVILFSHHGHRYAASMVGIHRNCST